MNPDLAPHAAGRLAEDSGDERSRAEGDEDGRSRSRRRRRTAETSGERRRQAENGGDKRRSAEDGRGSAHPPPPTRPTAGTTPAPLPPCLRPAQADPPYPGPTYPSCLLLPPRPHRAVLLYQSDPFYPRLFVPRSVRPTLRGATADPGDPFKSRPRWSACTFYKRLTEGSSQTKRTSAAALGKDYRALAEN
jgi:hypothetical protein